MKFKGVDHMEINFGAVLAIYAAGYGPLDHLAAATSARSGGPGVTPWSFLYSWAARSSRHAPGGHAFRAKARARRLGVQERVIANR